MATQYNKHGIRVVNSAKSKHKKRQHELHKLNFKEFAEFVGYENGLEITIIVPNNKPLVQAIQNDGWILQKFSRGEIA